jgi:N-acetyl-gamma-glutamyl-phosphate reductase
MAKAMKKRVTTDPSEHIIAPNTMRRIGIIGARGHTGSELGALVAGHPDLTLSFVSSRKLAGEPVPGFDGLRYEAIDADGLRERIDDADAVVLALPNGASEAFVAAAGDLPIVDLSADHRFDESWRYGLVELFRRDLAGARRVANPGCYATAAQLALAPIVELLTDEPRIFGVSGYSGAGTTPSPKNDPEQLRDNLMPYAPTGHTHEREITRHLGKAVRFMPHVAPFFRGITLTIDITLGEGLSTEALHARYQERYADEPLVTITGDAPLVRDNVGIHGVRIGGFATDGTRAVLVATIDNLLKGAATQALQNLNTMLGLDELAGIPENR